MKHSILIGLVASLALLSCSTEEVTYQSALETKTEFFLNRASDARAQLLREIRETRDTLEVAVTRLTDEEIANAIVTASKAGAKVRVVGDVDFATDAGFAILVANNIDVKFGNGELRYLPDPTLSSILDNCGFASIGDKVTCPSIDFFQPLSARQMVRPGSYNVMSHNFFILGPRVVWNFAAPLTADSTIPLAWRIDGELLKESFWREFNQLHAGVFATTLSIYNGPIKSGTQFSPIYVTEYGEFRMRFGPQERVIKTIIDDVYKARASVFIMTDSLTEQALIDALEYKASNGFNVRMIVNEAAQDVELLPRLRDIDVRLAPASLAYVPTMVIVDTEANRRNEVEQRRVHVASHPIWKTAPFQVFVSTPNDYVEIYKSDYFVDGLLWSLYAYKGQESANIDQLTRLFTTTWEASRETN